MLLSGKILMLSGEYDVSFFISIFGSGVHIIMIPVAWLDYELSLLSGEVHRARSWETVKAAEIWQKKK